MSWQHLKQPQGWIGVISLSIPASLADEMKYYTYPALKLIQVLPGDIVGARNVNCLHA